MNLLKKGSFLRKYYFNFDLDNFESSSENLLKVISTDAKTDVKQQEIK